MRRNQGVRSENSFVIGGQSPNVDHRVFEEEKNLPISVGHIPGGVVSGNEYKKANAPNWGTEHTKQNG